MTPSTIPRIQSDMQAPAGIVREKPSNVLNILRGVEWKTPEDEEAAAAARTHFNTVWYPSAHKEVIRYIFTLAQATPSSHIDLEKELEFPEEEVQQLKRALNELCKVYESVAEAVCHPILSKGIAAETLDFIESLSLNSST